MKVVFQEQYNRLSDMVAGDCAVSADRSKFFVCGYHVDALEKTCVLTILDVRNLRDQYVEKRDMSQPVKILKSGDEFTCKR